MQRALLAGAFSTVFAASSAFAINTAISDTSNFSSGVIDTGFKHPSAALGGLNGDTGFGGLNPFNPSFSSNDIVKLDPGDELTLHMAFPVTTVGKSLGIYSNNGIIDVGGGSGVAINPATTFNDPDFPRAIVSVSKDGTNFVSLNSGNPIDFHNPTNYYTDSSISGYYEPLGSVAANQEKPFAGSLSDFSGLTYPQMLTLLNGSAGGDWLDLSSSGLPEVNYVRFDVPQGADYSMVLDAVVAVPEPTMVLPLLIAASLIPRRNRKD